MMGESRRAGLRRFGIMNAILASQGRNCAKRRCRVELRFTELITCELVFFFLIRTLEILAEMMTNSPRFQSFSLFNLHTGRDHTTFGMLCTKNLKSFLICIFADNHLHLFKKTKRKNNLFSFLSCVS